MLIQKILISGSCLQICGPVHLICAFQFFAFSSKPASNNGLTKGTYVFVDVLARVREIIILFAEHVRFSDRTPGIMNFRLARTSVELSGGIE